MANLKQSIAEAMHKIVLDDLSKSPLKGGPLESMAIIDSLNYSSDKYKSYLNENKAKFNLTDSKIEEVIKECHNAVYNHFIT